MDTKEIISILNSRKHGWKMLMADAVKEKGFGNRIDARNTVNECRMKLDEIGIILKIIEEHQSKNREVLSQKLNIETNE